MLKKIVTYIRKNREIAATKKELYKLSSKELDDIGINRSMIHSIAYEMSGQRNVY